MIWEVTAGHSIIFRYANPWAPMALPVSAAHWTGLVIGGTDCGFAQGPFARRVHPSIMWAKLKSLVEGARIATRTLWGRRSAA